jgi:putative endonuclease
MDKLIAGFTRKHNIDRLIYYECFTDVHAAIAREKTIKGWLRAEKLALVASGNPKWHDLSEAWCD